MRPAGHDPGANDSSSFELVLICTGNRARSPIAEAFLRQLLAGLPVRLRSLGTLELGAAPPLPEALEACAAVGLDISDHRARALAAQDLREADLVLGFERHHLTAAVVDGGAPREHVFSLPELVQLIEETRASGPDDPIMRARNTIALAHARRDDHMPLTSAELADPLGRSDQVYRDTVERIRELSVRLAAGLFGQDVIRPLRAASDRATPARRRLRLGRRSRRERSPGR
jgi:protein-tyrosine phosphatase